MAPLFRIEPLSNAHDRSKFLSGLFSLDRYFREQASRDVKRNILTCFVTVAIETDEIAAFYTLNPTGVALNALPPEITKRLPRYPVVPAVLLGRLAVARGHQGKVWVPLF